MAARTGSTGDGVSNTSPIFEAQPRVDAVTLASGDTNVAKSVGTIGAYGTRFDSIMCSTNDTTAVNLAFYINDGATNFYIGVVALPIGTGYTTVARVDAMATLSPTLGYLVIPAGYLLKVGCVATMTADKVTTVACMGGDY
jgi:hypothetical protein